MFLAAIIFSDVMAFFYGGSGPFCSQINLIIIFVSGIFCLSGIFYISLRLKTLRKSYDVFLD